MAFTMSLWGVHDGKLAELPKQRLDSEDRLETWITQDVSLLGMDLLIIGRQVPTRFGGRINLLAVGLRRQSRHHRNEEGQDSKGDCRPSVGLRLLGKRPVL